MEKDPLPETFLKIVKGFGSNPLHFFKALHSLQVPESLAIFADKYTPTYLLKFITHLCFPSGSYSRSIQSSFPPYSCFCPHFQKPCPVPFSPQTRDAKHPHSCHPNSVCQDFLVDLTSQMVPTSLPQFLYLPLSFIAFTNILQRTRPRHRGRVSDVSHERQPCNGWFLPILVFNLLVSLAFPCSKSSRLPEGKSLLDYLLTYSGTLSTRPFIMDLVVEWGNTTTTFPMC